MKKYLFVLIFAVLAAPCVWAQNFKRTAKMPGFFIPKGALQTGSRQEKLVPVDQMRYKGQVAPVVTQMQQQAQEKAKQEAQEKAKQAELEKQRLQREARQEKIKQKELAKKEEAEKAAAAQETEAADTDYSDNTGDTAQRPLSPMEAARLKAEKIRAEQERLQEQKADEAKFAQIIEEYRNEVKAISDNKPAPNKRLMDMIADYKDMERPI